MLVQPDRRRYCLEDNLGQTARTRGGARMGLSKLYDSILRENWIPEKNDKTVEVAALSCRQKKKKKKKKINHIYRCTSWKEAEVGWGEGGGGRGVGGVKTFIGMNMICNMTYDMAAAPLQSDSKETHLKTKPKKSSFSR